MKFKWDKNNNKEKRKEIFNFKDKEGQSKFCNITSKTKYLSSVFDSKVSINEKAKQFLKRLNKLIRRCFKKVRIGTFKEDPAIQLLFEKRRKLLINNSTSKNRDKLEKVEQMLGEKCAERNVKIIYEETKNINCEDGGINSNKLWQLKKKLCPKLPDPPTAMINKDGHLVTSNIEIKELALDTFEKRLERNERKPEFKNIQIIKKSLFDEKIKKAKDYETT
jgi:hypothetical protein